MSLTRSGKYYSLTTVHVPPHLSKQTRSGASYGVTPLMSPAPRPRKAQCVPSKGKRLRTKFRLLGRRLKPTCSLNIPGLIQFNTANANLTHKYLFLMAPIHED